MINTSSTAEDTQVCPTYIDKHYNLSSGVVLLVFWVITIFLNSLIIFVIFGVKHRSLRWSLDYLVSFLAITDLVSTLVALPFPIVAYLQGFWPGSCDNQALESFSTFNITCKVFYLFVVWGRLSTMFIITMMCIERFLAITRPFIHREIVTAGRLRKCVYVIWSVMFVYCVLPILDIGHVSLHWNKHLDAGNASEPGYFFCFMDYQQTNLKTSQGVGNLIYSIVFVVFGFFTLITVLFCVFFICRILLVRRPQIKKSSKPQSSASSTYSVTNTPVSGGAAVKGKPSILQKSRTFISKRRPSIKKFEPEELQFIVLMLSIAGVFYCAFLPTMLLVISNIVNKPMSETFTFFAMRLTSFLVVANPLIYGLSNKLYRIGCLWVLRSFVNMFCCRRVPIPERLGPRRMSTVSGISGRRALTPAEKTAQEFMIAASRKKDAAIAKMFVGKIRREGKLVEAIQEEEDLKTSETACEPESPGFVADTFVAHNRAGVSEGVVGASPQAGNLCALVSLPMINVLGNKCAVTCTSEDQLGRLNGDIEANMEADMEAGLETDINNLEHSNNHCYINNNVEDMCLTETENSKRFSNGKPPIDAALYTLTSF